LQFELEEAVEKLRVASESARASEGERLTTGQAQDAQQERERSRYHETLSSLANDSLDHKKCSLQGLEEQLVLQESAVKEALTLQVRMTEEAEVLKEQQTLTHALALKDDINNNTYNEEEVLKAQLALQDNVTKETVVLQDKTRKEVETFKVQLVIKEESTCTHCDDHCHLFKSHLTLRRHKMTVELDLSGAATVFLLTFRGQGLSRGPGQGLLCNTPCKRISPTTDTRVLSLCHVKN
jgi:hypothetical protein